MNDNNMATLSQIQQLEGHVEYIWYVKWHPTKKLFASCGSDKNIILWEYSTTTNSYIKKAILSQSHKQTIRSLCWDPTGTYLASASFDKSINIWKEKDNSVYQCITSLDGHDSEVKGISWSISGQFLASCSRDKTIWIWEIDDNEEFSCNSVLQSHSQDIKSVKWSPREDILVSASFDNSIKLWGYSGMLDDWECLTTLSQHIGTVWSIDFNAIGDLFASCSDDLSVIIWRIDLSREDKYKHVEMWKVVKQVHSRPIYAVSFSYDDRFLVSCSADNSIGVIAMDEDREKIGVVRRITNAHSDDVNCVDCFKKENSVVSCSDDSTIKRWTLIDNNINNV